MNLFRISVILSASILVVGFTAFSSSDEAKSPGSVFLGAGAKVQVDGNRIEFGFGRNLFPGAQAAAEGQRDIVTSSVDGEVHGDAFAGARAEGADQGERSVTWLSLEAGRRAFAGAKAGAEGQRKTPRQPEKEHSYARRG